MQEIIDTHVHAFDPSRFRVKWIEEVPSLHRTISLDEYEALQSAHPEAYRVTGAVHVELDSVPEQKEAENLYFLERIAAGDPLLRGAVLYADMLNPEMPEALKRFQGDSFAKGVRYILHVDEASEGTCLRPAFVENAHRLAETGLHFEGCLRPGELMDFYQLARQCPETAFVLNHAGLPNLLAWGRGEQQDERKRWEEGIDALGSLPNVTCKVSGCPSDELDALRPVLEHCRRAFGPWRLMYASNFPVCTQDVSVSRWTLALLDWMSGRPEAERNAFFRDNAKRIYRLEVQA